MGGSFTQQELRDDKATNSIQDAQRVSTKINTALQAHVGPLADSCGRMAELLAQAPWEERRAGLGATQLGIKQHLGSHNSICHRLTQMLEDLPNPRQRLQNSNGYIESYNSAGCANGRKRFFNQRPPHRNSTW